MGAVTSTATRRRASRTYQVRTYGCQMNVHDSERLAGLLEAAGYRRAADGADADVVVFNTCAVRENADNKLYGNLSHLVPRKQADPDDADRRRRLPGAEGPRRGAAPGAVGGRRVRHAQHRLAADAAGSRPAQQGGAGRDRRGAGGVSVQPAGGAGIRLRRLGFDLGRLQQHLHVLHRARAARQGGRPQARRRAGRGAVAGRPGRPRGDAARAERQRLRRLVRRPRPARDRGAFAQLLRACGRIDGLERVRFTSPHPAEFTDDVIEAMAETAERLPALHMPMQSGSDRVLRAMRRSYRVRALPRR